MKLVDCFKYNHNLTENGIPPEPDLSTSGTQQNYVFYIIDFLF